MKKVFRSNYFRWGATIFVAGAVLILFYHMVAYYTGFRSGISDLSTILSPFIYGFVMAYLLGPVYNFVVKRTYPIFNESAKSHTKALRHAKTVATIVSLIVLIGIVVGMGALLVPQIIDSVSGISQTLPNNLNHLSDMVNEFLDNMENTALADTIQSGFDEIQGNLLSWVQNTFLPGVGSLVQRVSSGLIFTIKTIFNMVIGVIACAYFLNGKELFRAQYRKIVRALFKEERAQSIFDFMSYSNKTFGGFVTGKVIDSFIVGILCFVAMAILKLPYPVLISTIIGITNIIPFFGPFIGAIPSAMLIFLVSPLQALYFVILIIVLQQLDGNVIGPAILGNSIGIASFWVMFAIIVGGGLFGFIGMVLGVPVFAIIYYYLGRWVGNKLDKKGMPSRTEDYISYEKYDIEPHEILDEEPEETFIDEALEFIDEHSKHMHEEASKNKDIEGN